MTLSPEMLGLLAPAFFAGLVVASTHAPLGQEVLRRGIIFIDLAIAQIAALGVVVANAFFHVEEGRGFLPVLLALIFALGAGQLFAWLERKAPEHQEAFIGSAFALSASLSVLLLASDPHGGEHMQGLLAGQILWVNWTQIILTGFIYALLLALWFGMKDKRAKLFFFVFPVMITLSVQLVGVYLVFASLIIPALATVQLTARKRTQTGYAIAAISFAGGLIASTIFDFPAGPAIVCCYPFTALLLFLFLKEKKRA